MRVYDCNLKLESPSKTGIGFKHLEKPKKLGKRQNQRQTARVPTMTVSVVLFFFIISSAHDFHLTDSMQNPHPPQTK